MSKFAHEHTSAGTLHSVIEIFGPTIQGEGYLAGQVTHFIRFAGCGYRCSWCDSMHAVDPAQILKHRELLTNEDIIHRLAELGPSKWVTLSGGDPCIRGNLSDLIRSLALQGYLVSVETQGQFYQDWLRSIDYITLSPKPPSSEMPFDTHALGEIIRKLSKHEADDRMCFKIVIFNDADLEFARMVHREWPTIRMFLSVGTPVPTESIKAMTQLEQDTYATGIIMNRMRWLFEAVAADPSMHHVTVFPQLHVLAWGTKQGV